MKLHDCLKRWRGEGDVEAIAGHGCILRPQLDRELIFTT